MNKKLFITLEILIYITFMTLDILKIDFHQDYLKYLGVVLCLVYASLEAKNIFLVTLIADYFLLIRDDHYITGVIIFIVVQVLYFFYLRKLNIKNYYPLRMILCLIGLIAVSFIMPSPLNYLTIVYFSQLLCSSIEVTLNKKHNLLALGLCLFVCCDICVGLHNLLPYSHLVSLGQWFFYLPSQVLIALSSNGDFYNLL